jgi:predicted lipoprotein with Yx(FWY)xxD motif
LATPGRGRFAGGAADDRRDSDDAGASGVQLQKATVKPYAGLLANAKHHTYYVLSAEKSGSIHCKAARLTIWIPFFVTSSVASVPEAAGVAGKIGFVKRSSSMKQVTFTGYPVYLFSGARDRTR